MNVSLTDKCVQYYIIVYQINVMFYLYLYYDNIQGIEMSAANFCRFTLAVIMATWNKRISLFFY